MEILIRVLSFQKLIRLHSNMLPGCVFRGLVYILFSLPVPTANELKGPQGKTWNSEGSKMLSEMKGHFPEMVGERHLRGGQQWPGHGNAVSSPVIMSEADNNQTHGSICTVTLGIFPAQQTLLILVKCQAAFPDLPRTQPT